MFAYAPDGTPITAIKEICPGIAGIAEDGFALDAGGNLACEYDGGGTKMDWDAQTPVVLRGQQIVIDENDVEWPVCALVVLETERGEDDGGDPLPLPPAAVAMAKAAHAAWIATAKGGATPVKAATLSGDVSDIVDLATPSTMVVKVTGIDWDTDDDSDETEVDLSPMLPTDLTVRVPASIDLEDGQLADLLSDRYGFCVRSIASTERVTG